MCVTSLLPSEPLARDQVCSFVPSKSEDKIVSFAKDGRESQEFIETIQSPQKTWHPQGHDLNMNRLLVCSTDCPVVPQCYLAPTSLLIAHQLFEVSSLCLISSLETEQGIVPLYVGRTLQRYY